MADSTDDKLRLLIERIEGLESEKKGVSDDIKDVYAEAKSQGYCTKTMKAIVKLRKMKPDDRNYLNEMLEVYASAVGLE